LDVLEQWTVGAQLVAALGDRGALYVGVDFAGDPHDVAELIQGLYVAAQVGEVLHAVCSSSAVRPVLGSSQRVVRSLSSPNWSSTRAMVVDDVGKPLGTVVERRHGRHDDRSHPGEDEHVLQMNLVWRRLARD
jgi:hypothetical protein